MRKAISAYAIAVLLLCGIAFSATATAIAPTEYGNILGRVADQNASGIANAIVKIVDASDTSIVYFTGTTDSRGLFYFTEVNNTWNETSGTYTPKYKAHASLNIDSQTYVGYSSNFTVEANSIAMVCMVLYITP